MRCPRCGHEEDRVIDSRAVRDGKGVRRRRECVACAHRFTTYEYVEPAAFLVVKRDGRRESYQREKLRRGILRACEKRPTAAEAIEALVDRLETRLLRAGREEISTREIGRLVLGELRALDQVAYVRFASVYRRFDSIGEFVDIVAGMLPEPPGDTGLVTGESEARGGLEDRGEPEARSGPEERPGSEERSARGDRSGEGELPGGAD